MSRRRVYIAGVGIVSALGAGCDDTFEALAANRSGLETLRLFSLLTNTALPVAEVCGVELDVDSPLPRTHQLALNAALQAMAGQGESPDAIVLGTTTGGVLTTEQLLRDGETESGSYQFHGLTTVAEELADELECTGQICTVSTACSSGTAAIGIALRLLRSGQARRVLVGGVDSLCRLTYFGFHSLQLVDPTGARPMDTQRKGMTVGEGAAMLLLSTERPDNPLAEIAGIGLSCDAYHPATPHPEGRGAIMAMQAALKDAGIKPEDVDYINLHGTGTPDNDQAESRAVQSLFTTNLPPLSSIKGATGHSLAAAGAIEAVVAALAVSGGLLPANIGCLEPDPQLVRPLLEPVNRSVFAALSNSFGFGGNNGSLVISAPDRFPVGTVSEAKQQPLTICGMACLTGSGDLVATITDLRAGKKVGGMQTTEQLSSNLEPRKVRRLKRLSRMTLSLAVAAHLNSGLEQNPTAVFMGTGWGALSETCDFLTRLEETNEQFPSPTDFIGSVHNGAAGQVAMQFKATGANITASGGDYSFEQALMTAELLAGDEPCFVLGADEGHERFSPLFDPSIVPGSELADGGGGFCLQRGSNGGQTISASFFMCCRKKNVISHLVDSLGGKEAINQQYGLILVGIPAAVRGQAETQLQQFRDLTGGAIPVVDYRQYIGQFASASAVAAVLGTGIVESGAIPAGLTSTDHDIPCRGSVLILGLGRYITAMGCGRA